MRGHNLRAALVWLLVVGVYAGYFGAAQGIMLLAVMGLSLDAPLVRINGYKTVDAGISNAASSADLFVRAGFRARPTIDGALPRGEHLRRADLPRVGGPATARRSSTAALLTLLREHDHLVQVGHLHARSPGMEKTWER